MLKELKNIIRLVLPALLLSFVSGAAEWSVVSAQVQVEQRIDSIEMLIGEQTLLHLQVTMKNGTSSPDNISPREWRCLGSTTTTP